MAKRINMLITEQQAESLDKLKEKTGIAMSEAIRRAIDEYLKKELKD